MSTFYRAYGLRIGANRAIPGLAPVSAEFPMDLQIELGTLPPDVIADEPVQCALQDSDEYARLEEISWGCDHCRGFRIRYADGTIFIVDEGGTRLWAAWPAPLTVEDTAVYLLGPVLAFVLHLRGITCLHASAFAVDDLAIALVGPSGAGKSTTAAALAGRGFPVLTDDLLALEEQHHGVVAHSGYPRLRLWPEAVTTLYGAPDALPALTPNWDKRYLDLQGNTCKFEHRPLPLSAIYLLDERRGDSAAPLLESLTASAALLRLLANARGAYHFDRQSRRREFEFLGRLVRRVPFKRVVGGTGPQSLSDLCNVVIESIRVSSHRAMSERRHICMT